MSDPLVNSLRSLPKPAQRAIAITLSCIAAALLIVLLALRPLRAQIQRNAREIEELQRAESAMRLDIARTAAAKSTLAATNAALDALRAEGVLEPLLGSFAMRGKTLLDPVALQAGFRIENVRELPPIPLQMPKPPPEQTHIRQPVEFTGQGSYDQIAAFIAQAEAAQPLATLCGLAILCQPNTPEVHRAIITFEWPAKGEKIKPAAPAAKGKPTAKKPPAKKK